jgi:hypothetical protein
MARWTASAQWAAGPALAGRRDMPLALRLSEGLGISARGRPTGLSLCARDCASRFALRQEQSRYSASAAHAKSLAGRSAPCIADRQCCRSSWQARPLRHFGRLSSQRPSCCCCLDQTPLVISLWLCRSCPGSSHLPLRLWLNHGAEMYLCGSAACGCSVHADRRTFLWGCARPSF